MPVHRRVTIKDVARAAGVSAATVSYVLNGQDRVSEAVALRVQDAVRLLGYRPNPRALALKTGQSRVIACILPTLTSPILPEIARAVQVRAEALGYAMILIDTDRRPQREAEALRMLADYGVDGAVAMLGPDCPVPGPGGPPLVMIDTRVAGFDCVRADHLAGGVLIAQEVARLGHRRVGLLSGPQGLHSSRDRRAGFLAAAGIRPVWEAEVPLEPELPDPAVRLLAGGDVTAVVCVNDVVAVAALSALRDLGRRVPEDVAVIGFDDMAMAHWPLIRLTTVHQPLSQLGARAVDLLIERQGDPGLAAREVVLPVHLVRRATT